MHSNHPTLVINRGMEPSEVIRLLENASWFTSSVLLALLELTVVLLLLLGATISYLTFIIVKFFDLHPPCCYPGAGLMEETISFCGSQCAACSHCCADTNNNSCPVSSNSKYHLSEKRMTHCKNRRAHLRSHQSTISINDKNCARLKGGTRCMYCSSLFQQPSDYHVKKRKFVTLIPGKRTLSKFQSSLSVVPDEELSSDVAFPFIKVERESGSKVFSEDILVPESEEGEDTLAKPFDKMLCEKSLSVCEEIIHKKVDDFQLKDSVQSSLSQDIFHIKNKNEDLSNQLRLVSEDFREVLNSGNIPQEEGKMQCNSPRISQQKFLTFGSLDEKIKDSVQCGTKEIEMEVFVKSDKGNIENEADMLRKMLNTERETLSALYLELEQERSASAIAANETMAMIDRLQKEKAALQMEAIQFQRIAEEKAMYDREAIVVLKDILMKREAEKLALEKEVELYRWRLLKDRIEELERTTKDRGSNSKVAISGDDAELILLLEEKTKSKSFRSGDSEGDSFFTTIQASEDTDEQLCSSETILNSYLIAHLNNDLQLDDQENQCQSNMLSLSTSYSSVTGIDEDKIHISGDKYMVIPKDGTPCEGIQRRVRDEWAGCSDSCHILPTSDGSFPVKDGDGIEDSVVGKPRCNSREKWQTVLERLQNLECQIQHLNGKQNAERPDLPIVDLGAILYKDPGIGEAYNANPSWEMLERRCGQEDLSFEHNDWFSLVQNGETNFNTPSYTKRLHDLECNDTPDLSKIQSGEQCIQNIIDSSERSCSLSAYTCTLNPKTNEQNIRQCDSYTLNDNTFIKGGENFDFKTEAPQKPSGLVSMEAVSSMLEENALAGNVGTLDQFVNHESLELLDKQYSNISRYLDLRTLSMVIRDNSRIAIDEEVQELTSRLQALEADREFMRQRIESMKQERAKVEMLQEVRRQFEELI